MADMKGERAELEIVLFGSTGSSKLGLIWPSDLLPVWDWVKLGETGRPMAAHTLQ